MNIGLAFEKTVTEMEERFVVSCDVFLTLILYSSARSSARRYLYHHCNVHKTKGDIATDRDASGCNSCEIKYIYINNM